MRVLRPFQSQAIANWPSFNRSQPFEGAHSSDYGFSSRMLKSLRAENIPLGGDVAQTVSWNYDRKQMTAQVTFQRDKVKGDIVATGAGPDYQAMWKDGGLRGVVVTGSNMGSAFSDSVMQNYLAYYTDEGFDFKTKREGVNLKEYLKEKAMGPNPMHYLVKEAHSDGDEKNLFRMDKSADVLIGSRQVGDKTEYVELVFPSKSNPGSELLSNN